MKQSLSELLAKLDTVPGPVPLNLLSEELAKTSIVLSDVQRNISFGEQTYRRNLLHEGPAYHALVLCWRSGQRSPIHDHSGSSCAVYVLQGKATETLFAQTAEGLIYATSTQEQGHGEVIGSYDGDIHQISNLQPEGQDLITLHLYSPPLLKMNLYSLTDRTVATFYDPIEFFSEGAGI